MMGRQRVDQSQLFYLFNLGERIPAQHLLRRINPIVTRVLAGLHEKLAPLYSDIGRPSIDPELMIRMLIVGYCYGIRFERQLCEEVELHLAYRWFCRLDLDDKVPDHSTFSVNRHGRFRDSDILRHVFEVVVRAACRGRYGRRIFKVNAAPVGSPVDFSLLALADEEDRNDLHALRRRANLFREGDPPDSVFRLISGSVEILREVDGDPSLLGAVGAGQFLGEMGVVENRPRSATARAASEVEVEILAPAEFLDQIARSPQAARELIQRLSQRLRQADDRIVNDERRSNRAQKAQTDADGHTAVVSVNNAHLSAKSPWLQRQFRTPLGLNDLPFIVGRGPVAREGLPLLQPDLKLDDTVAFRLSRNHFMIERRKGSYYVRDLSSRLGTIVNGEPIGEHFRGDVALLRAGENEVIAGGVGSPFVFSVFIG